MSDQMSELHLAARSGSVERTVAALSKGVIDIDEGTPFRVTPLMIAAHLGYARIARILLNKGANVAIKDNNGFTALLISAEKGHLAVTKLLVDKGANVAVTDKDGYTALHISANNGHLAVTKLLVKAGSDLGAAIFATDSTPLHVAAERGHSEIVRVLIEAGSNPNTRYLDGATPLYFAAEQGHVEVVKVLLRAKANPLLTCLSSRSGSTSVPLDVAAQNGHLEIAHELIEQHGIEGCGGASGGMYALRLAAQSQQVHMMSMLTSAGVVDTGMALTAAAAFGRESSVKFLLQQQQERKASGEGAGYLETCGIVGTTPMLNSIRACSPRVTRMLVDAGADTTTAVRLTPTDGSGDVLFNDTPLAYAERILAGKTIEGRDATESQLHSLEATRRLLMRVEAAHAVSWLWANQRPFTTHAAAEGTGRAAKATPTPLMLMLPILRRRVGRPRVLLAALLRYSRKPY